MRVTCWLAAVVVLTLGAAAAGRAAEEPGRDRARTFLMLRMVEALDLKDDKALELRNILRRTDDRRSELLAQRETLQGKLRLAIEHTPRDEAAVAALVEEGVRLDRELATLPERSFAEAQKILTVEQQGKLLLLRRDLQGQVHQAMRRRLGGKPAAPATPHTPATAAPHTSTTVPR